MQQSFWSAQFIHPRYWPTWLGLLLLLIMSYMPMRIKQATAHFAGFLAYTLAHKRRSITETNLTLAFPELDQTAHKKLVKAVFYENMLGLLDTGLAKWGNRTRLMSQCEIIGGEHITEALAQQKGILLVGAHYSCLDLGGLLFSLFYPVDIMYRPHKNALFNLFLERSRLSFCYGLIEKSNVRAMIRSLKKGHIFWYPADQDYGAKHSVFAPFFGVEAATINITSRLAALSGATVLVFSCHRIKLNHYRITISPAIQGIDSSNLEQEAATINHHLEHEIRKFPAQYMWVHRRYKTRPEGQPSLYSL